MPDQFVGMIEAATLGVAEALVVADGCGGSARAEATGLFADDDDSDDDGLGAWRVELDGAAVDRRGAELGEAGADGDGAAAGETVGATRRRDGEGGYDRRDGEQPPDHRTSVSTPTATKTSAR